MHNLYKLAIYLIFVLYIEYILFADASMSYVLNNLERTAIFRKFSLNKDSNALFRNHNISYNPSYKLLSTATKEITSIKDAENKLLYNESLEAHKVLFNNAIQSKNIKVALFHLEKLNISIDQKLKIYLKLLLLDPTNITLIIISKILYDQNFYLFVICISLLYFIYKSRKLILPTFGNFYRSVIGFYNEFGISYLYARKQDNYKNISSSTSSQFIKLSENEIYQVVFLAKKISNADAVIIYCKKNENTYQINRKFYIINLKGYELENFLENVISMYNNNKFFIVWGIKCKYSKLLPFGSRILSLEFSNNKKFDWIKDFYLITNDETLIELNYKNLSNNCVEELDYQQIINNKNLLYTENQNYMQEVGSIFE